MARFTTLSLPLRIGLIAGLIGLALTLVGIARGNVPLQPASIAAALLIGGGFWFLVAWAVATAAVDVERDVERDVAEAEALDVASEEVVDSA